MQASPSGAFSRLSQRFSLTSILPALTAITAAVLPAYGSVSSGLTAYWDFDDNLSDKAVLYPFAASTVADDGTFVDEATAGYGSGLFGRAYQGAGGAGYVAVPSSSDVSGVETGSVSVSFWFKAVGPTTTWQAAVALGEGSAWRVARFSGDEPMKMGYAGGSSDIASTTTFGNSAAPVAEWHHLVAVTEGGVATRLFIDGVLEATGGAPTLTDNGSSELWIGGNPQATGRSWNGLLDDLGVWNRALTAADVAHIYAEGKNSARSLGALLAQEALDGDADGLPDTWEIANLPAGAATDNGSVNPNFGPNGDPDTDLSTNLQEYTRNTNPQLADTDGDGVKDGAETDTGNYASATDTGTDPLIPDTDGDSLKDGVETRTGTFVSATNTGTDPLLQDTDADTFSDGIEVNYGSDPTKLDSVPAAGSLPIVDSFADGLFDSAVWNTDLTAATGGAAVAEQDGHITLTGRGHFFTRQQFDPTTLGGIYLAGKWTFRSTDDFIQILTRSDAVPSGQYGETQEGIEFYASQTDNSINISVRGGAFTVDSQQRSGAIALVSGHTYDLTVIDDGVSYLSFRLTEVGNPGNAAIINANVSSSAATANYVVLHNRESGRISHLEELTIDKLTDTDGDGLPDFWETANGLDKTVANAGGDSDGDGLPNSEEYKKGLKPTNADSDGDGFLDGRETQTGTWVSATDTGTDPLRQDSDGDGLLDGVETNTGVFVNAAQPGTNPNLPDTDGDGMGDGPEITVGRNPVNPADGRTGLDVGLTAYWSFDGTLNDVAHGQTYGESTVADNGAFTGEPDVAFATTGHFGSSALELTGGAGWVTVPKSVDTIGNQATRNVSVSVWLQANGFDSDWQAAISHGEGSHWRIARQGGTSPANMAYAGGSADIYSTTTFEPPTEWYHVVAVTTSGTGTELYINGVLESTGGVPTLDVALASSQNLFIGANPQSGGREWNGQIDDAAIWNRPLTQEEITSIYEAGVQGRSLGVLLGGTVAPTISITGYQYNTATKQVSLTWTSTPGATYAIRYNTSLAGNWTGSVTESQPAAAGATTTYSFAVPEAVSNAAILFFRVQAN